LVDVIFMSFVEVFQNEEATGSQWLDVWVE
jgi:hypothetical protein